MGGVFEAAVTNTVLRVGIDAAGFGAGTFVGDIGAQQTLDLLTKGQLGPVDWGSAGRDAAIATAGGVVFGALLHGRAPDPTAAGAGPTPQQWGIGVNTVDADGQRVSYFALSKPDGEFLVFEGSPTTGAREIGAAGLVDGSALVATDGSFRIDLSAPRSDVLVRTQGSASWIRVGEDGAPLIFKEAGTSDGTIRFNFVPGDQPLHPDLSIDPNGDMTVPKDWRVVSEPVAGRSR